MVISEGEICISTKRYIYHIEDVGSENEINVDIRRGIILILRAHMTK